jgi:hypothetical protein
MRLGSAGPTALVVSDGWAAPYLHTGKGAKVTIELKEMKPADAAAAAKAAALFTMGLPVPEPDRIPGTAQQGEDLGRWK